MTIAEESREFMNYLDMACLSERSRIVLDFAKKHGLAKGTITLPNQEVHAAAAFAFHTYAKACDIGHPSEDNNEHESFQIVALLVALQEISTDNWNYGSRIMYLLDIAQYSYAGTDRDGNPVEVPFRLSVSEVDAFMAQKGTFSGNSGKMRLMEGNLLAVSIHCGRLWALYNTLPGYFSGLSKAKDGAALQNMLFAREVSAQYTIEKLALTYIVARIGEENKNRVMNLLRYLRNHTDFYIAPATERYHPLSGPGGLAQYTVDAIYNTAELLLPATEAQIGEIVMAGLCQAIGKINVFYEGQAGYEVDDNRPFGYPVKALHIAVRYLGNCLPENVAAAIDAHMHDLDENPRVGLQMMEQPFGLFLHMGCIKAMCTPSAGTKEEAENNAES